MKPDFDAIAADLERRTLAAPGKILRELIASQLRLMYQSGIVDGLRQSETAVKAAFDKFQGRVEP